MPEPRVMVMSDDTAKHTPGSMLSPRGRIPAVLSCIVLLVTCYFSLYSRHLIAIFIEKHHASRKATPEPRTDLDDKLNYRARPGVQTQTSWNAPIMWELMFDNNLFDRQHKKANTTVALTVFAVGRYLEAYLKTFLASAEEHFMLGLPVTYFVFTDLPEKVPNIKLAPHRNIQVVKVEKHSRWQDISMMRMKTISEVIDTVLQHNFTYVFCFDVDQKFFKARFGFEALGESVALLHAHFYKLPKNCSHMTEIQSQSLHG
ncbi:hypothetical protein CRENBAI_001359 [Crenichthys baileyi]|uniref:Uncharacterized protein n=1 Tax=Crenichthys baileyi TaxID=28760 RepID=A0AAV9QTG2_9TELE